MGLNCSHKLYLFTQSITVAKLLLKKNYEKPNSRCSFSNINQKPFNIYMFMVWYGMVWLSCLQIRAQNKAVNLQWSDKKQSCKFPRQTKAVLSLIQLNLLLDFLPKTSHPSFHWTRFGRVGKEVFLQCNINEVEHVEEGKNLQVALRLISDK